MDVVDSIFSVLKKGNDIANNINDVAKVLPKSLPNRASKL